MVETAGIYVSVSGDATYNLRFYPDGYVVAMTTQGEVSPDRLAGALSREADHVSQGWLVQERNLLRALLTSEAGSVLYEGVITGSCTLNVFSRSLINGHASFKVYRYVAFSSDSAAAPSPPLSADDSTAMSMGGGNQPVRRDGLYFFRGSSGTYQVLRFQDDGQVVRTGTTAGPEHVDKLGRWLTADHPDISVTAYKLKEGIVTFSFRTQSGLQAYNGVVEDSGASSSLISRPGHWRHWRGGLLIRTVPTACRVIGWHNRLSDGPTAQRNPRR